MLLGVVVFPFDADGAIVADASGVVQGVGDGRHLIERCRVGERGGDGVGGAGQASDGEDVAHRIVSVLGAAAEGIGEGGDEVGVGLALVGDGDRGAGFYAFFYGDVGGLGEGVDGAGLVDAGARSRPRAAVCCG